VTYVWNALAVIGALAIVLVVVVYLRWRAERREVDHFGAALSPPRRKPPRP
jgi:hypothetical protein